MRKIKQANLLVGLAIGLAGWTLLEFFLLFAQASEMPEPATAIFSGVLLGGALTTLFGMREGFFLNNPLKINRAVKAGLIGGTLGGALSFFLSQQITLVLPDTFISHWVAAQKWPLLALVLGGSLGFIDRSNKRLTRGLLTGAITGVFGLLWFSVLGAILPSPGLIRGFGLVGFSLFFSLFDYLNRNYRRKEWLRALNGELEGLEFELTQEIHFLGTQSDDDINLDSYEDINTTHAKLIRYFSGYSLVDNDPFGRTFVNYRNITEQPLKNGDLIKIGDALFQYNQVA